MALNTDALTTAAKARVWLGQDGAKEERLDLLINGYSRAIRRYTEREFAPKVDAATRKFRYDGNGYLTLAPYDLRAVTTVVLYSDFPAASQVTLSAGSGTEEADYRLEPRNKTTEGTYLWVAIAPLASSPPPVRSSRFNPGRLAWEVSVTGDWGCASVPADVEIACLVAVANAYRNPESVASRTVGEFSLGEFADDPEQPGLALPRGARALLAPYRRLQPVV